MELMNVIFLKDLWTDPKGSALSYLPWSGIEPNGVDIENCGALKRWNFFDIRCGLTLEYICQVPAANQ